MALGFLLADGITLIRPDNNLARRTAPRVLRAKFGDGYEQRMPDGINSLEMTYDVSFANRPPSEIDELVYFFDSMLGVTAFDFTIPDTKSDILETTIKVVCDTYDIVYTNKIASGCVASFRRVYE